MNNFRNVVTVNKFHTLSGTRSNRYHSKAQETYQHQKQGFWASLWGKTKSFFSSAKTEVGHAISATWKEVKQVASSTGHFIKETRDDIISIPKGIVNTGSVLVYGVIGIVALLILNAASVGQGIHSAGEGIAKVRGIE